MAGNRWKTKDIVNTLSGLRGFSGGVADTSTLIYLQRLTLLPLAAASYTLVVIQQVQEEFGMMPPGCTMYAGAPSGPADRAVCLAAGILQQPVLSEDKAVLLAAKREQLPYYNCLMILLALHVQQIISRSKYLEFRQQLLVFARYGSNVTSFEDKLFRALQRS